MALTLIQRMVQDPRHAGDLETLRKMGYRKFEIGVPGDQFIGHDGTSDFTRAGHSCLNHSVCAATATFLVGLRDSPTGMARKAMLGMKPHKAREVMLAAQHGHSGYDLYRASVSQILVQEFDYAPDTAILATMSGHTANEAIAQLLLTEARPELNPLPLITYWVAARACGKGGLETADQRLAALTQTWARRTGQSSPDQSLMEQALRNNMSIAQRAGDVLVNMAKLQSDDALVQAVNDRLEAEYPDLDET